MPASVAKLNNALAASFGRRLIIIDRGYNRLSFFKLTS